MFSLAYNLPKTMSNFCPSKLRRKKWVKTTWIFRTSKLHWKKYVEKTWTFLPSKIHRQEYVETRCIFRPSKLHRKKYVEITWIFDQQNYVEKSTRKWRGNSSNFGLWRIDVISTSNDVDRCGVGLLLLLQLIIFKKICWKFNGSCLK